MEIQSRDWDQRPSKQITEGDGCTKGYFFQRVYFGGLFWKIERGHKTDTSDTPGIQIFSGIMQCAEGIMKAYDAVVLNFPIFICRRTVIAQEMASLF